MFEFWVEACRPSSTPQPKLTDERRAKLKARLREGYTTDQIRQAITGAAVGAFVDESGKRHDDLTLICRNGSKLEDFIGRAKVTPIRAKRFAGERDPGRFEGAF